MDFPRVLKNTQNSPGTPSPPPPHSTHRDAFWPLRLRPGRRSRHSGSRAGLPRPPGLFWTRLQREHGRGRTVSRPKA